jgi:uncharacterized protein YutE (UPF0331/DUF86 family)
VDRPLIAQKLESLRRALRRVETRCPASAMELANDVDAQDIVTLNLSRAVQICVDVGAHLISGTELPAPNTMGQTFDVLATGGIITPALAERMKKAVGFRNIAVHSYDTINWAIVHAIASRHLSDFEDFARAAVQANNAQRT